MPDVTAELEQVFSAVGARGFVHAREVEGDREVGLSPDEPVIAASTFKVPVLLEYAVQVAEGRLSPTDRIRVPVEGRADGPTGLSAFSDEVEMSLRDLAVSMMMVSDNAATDVICDLVGLSAVEARLAGLGITHTRLPTDCRGIYRSINEDLDGTGATIETVSPEALAGFRCLDPAQTDATTPRDMTTLLSLVWRDEAGPPDACAEVRRVMALQVWPHRLTAGFPADVTLAGKTGTLPSVYNEVAVITYPDSQRYAVAVYIRSSSYALRQPAMDRAIGEAGALVVEALRDQGR